MHPIHGRTDAAGEWNGDEASSRWARCMAVAAAWAQVELSVDEHRIRSNDRGLGSTISISTIRSMYEMGTMSPILARKFYLGNVACNVVRERWKPTAADRAGAGEQRTMRSTHASDRARPLRG
jgi:hypothetical protein